jgi:hypothetical protein
MTTNHAEVLIKQNKPSKTALPRKPQASLIRSERRVVPFTSQRPCTWPFRSPMARICRMKVSKSIHQAKPQFPGAFPKNIPVLNHTLDLPPHGQEDQDQPVNDKNGPEDGQVEDLAPAAGKGNADGAGRRVPELELGQAADKGLELLVALGGERRCARWHAVLHVRVRLEAGVEFGRDEGEEEVEEVDAERVGDCVGSPS